MIFFDGFPVKIQDSIRTVLCQLILRVTKLSTFSPKGNP